jgi:hypothetical protein
LPKYPKTRTLNTDWANALNLINSICQISSASEMVYCWGSRNREWTVEGIDRKTGKKR